MEDLRHTKESMATEMKDFMGRHGANHYARMAEEMQLLVEMVFGKDYRELRPEDKRRMKDLHDVVDHYRQRAAGGGVDVQKAVLDHRERVAQVMDTYRWVIGEVRARYSPSQLKYVETLVNYLDEVQDLLGRYLELHSR